jgi:cytochrome c oxidase subunit II
MQGIALAIALVVIVVGSVALTVSGLWWFTPLASNWGAIDTMMIITFVLTGVAFIGVNLFIAYTVVQHRHRDGRRGMFLADNPALERLLILGTTVGIVALLAPGLVFYAQAVSNPEDAMVIEVVGEQWRWSYRYAGEDGALGRADNRLVTPQNALGLDMSDPASLDDRLAVGGPMYLPVNTPVLLRIRSKDVLHSFFVPQFRLKMDAVPGMVTDMWFTPTRTGEFQNLCAEFCGIGHYAMVGRVVVVEQEEFEQWLAQRPVAGEVIPR